jgi:hypothetical protein
VLEVSGGNLEERQHATEHRIQPRPFFKVSQRARRPSGPIRISSSAAPLPSSVCLFTAVHEVDLSCHRNGVFTQSHNDYIGECAVAE